MIDPEDPKKCVPNPKEEVPTFQKPEQNPDKKKKRKKKRDRKKKKKRPKGTLLIQFTEQANF